MTLDDLRRQIEAKWSEQGVFYGGAILLEDVAFYEVLADIHSKHRFVMSPEASWYGHSKVFWCEGFAVIRSQTPGVVVLSSRQIEELYKNLPECLRPSQ